MTLPVSDLITAVRQGDVGRVRSLLRQRPELANMDVAENDEHRALHHAVLRCDEPMVRLLVSFGADAHKGIYPHREATTAWVLAKERGFDDMVAAIEEEEQFLRQNLSCPNATVSAVQQDLNEAIRRGEETAALEMLRRDPSLARACDRDGGTPLHVACEAGALKVIDWLLENHANPRKEDRNGLTPLERAVGRVRWRERELRTRIPEVAARLLRHGAPTTPRVAAALGDLEALERLFRHDPDSLTEGSWNSINVLSTAVMFGRLEAVKLLLDLGLDPNESVTLQNVEEEIPSRGHPLWLAAAFGEDAIARLLLGHGADPNAQVYASGTPVDRAYGANDTRMKSLLAEFGGRPSPGTIGLNCDTAAAKNLLEIDASENTVRELLWAAACGGDPETVRLCLSRIPWERDDSRWHTIMVQPLRIWNHSPIREHPEDFDRSTYPECLRLILHHGVNINLTGKHGNTLMHDIAAEGKCWGIDVMTTPERLAFARLALDASPDLSLRDTLLRSTPLGWACRWGRLELVELLLERGAPPREPEAEPWATPLAWARKGGFPAIAGLLEKVR